MITSVNKSTVHLILIFWSRKHVLALDMFITTHLQRALPFLASSPFSHTPSYFLSNPSFLPETSTSL